MGDGYSVSRGNPRSSSVGEEEDLTEVRYRSTSVVDPTDPVTITSCEETLNSPADNNEPVWEDRDDLDTTVEGNTDPVWDNRDDLVGDQQPSIENRDDLEFGNVESSWDNKDDLEYSGDSGDTSDSSFAYTSPTTETTNYLYTSDIDLGRFDWPNVDNGNDIQIKTDGFSNGEVAIDETSLYLFVAHQDGIYRFSLSGGDQTQIKSSTDIDTYGLAVDPLTNTLYVTYGSQTGLYSMDYDGANETKIATTVNAGLSIDVAPDGGDGGYIFGLDAGDNKIYRWDLSGGGETVIVDRSSSLNSFARVLQIHLSNQYVFYQQEYYDGSSYERYIVRTDMEGNNGVSVVSEFSSSFEVQNPRWAVLENELKIVQINPDTTQTSNPDVESWDLSGNNSQNEGEVDTLEVGNRLEASTPMS